VRYNRLRRVRLITLPLCDLRRRANARAAETPRNAICSSPETLHSEREAGREGGREGDGGERGGEEEREMGERDWKRERGSKRACSLIDALYVFLNRLPGRLVDSVFREEQNVV